MSLNVVATQKFLKNLTCAYTGKKITVRIIAAGGAAPLFFSPDAFDPADFQETPEELFAMLGTRDGIRNCARNGNELTCPYTNARMTIQKVPGLGFQAVGGFSPRTPVSDPALYARLMLTRAGKVPKDAPKSAVAPKVVPREPAEGPEDDPSATAGVAGETADRILRAQNVKKVVVVAPGTENLK